MGIERVRKIGAREWMGGGEARVRVRKGEA